MEERLEKLEKQHQAMINNFADMALVVRSHTKLLALNDECLSKILDIMELTYGVSNEQNDEVGDTNS